MKNKNKDSRKIEIAEDLSIERNDLTDRSKEGYNFVGNLNNWTSIEEQKTRVKEIEKKTKNT